ncbi:uncharacterized protein [Neodiprion pinetum]|uniref:Uncharacterized protein LOC107227275 n=1 Tax=Neodiprion lecontei TaxID=441921 RepID=A0A6J0CBC5_NEOLC|nr:uncharacterized protein LOC107227275 [Neodiprion lecontei]XP_015523868.1 uncharacterized protein LOC107227275 [Neodiprion lecontei]XP_046431952.1 uncharacterized protein LOC124185329 [Neodiprion fabricii]XP_046488060.1 uncharacterized protein LOC124221788 [Neodiprion pinetum]XP_046488061.1 uncharacterized protein LOC124221788 [Neodiprion pinetum]XP_046625492.1 uncharacterized protein LOC124307632 [Neodiprion virginianus]
MLVRSRKYDNETLDVINKGCLDLYDGIACGRVSILALLCLLTFFLIVLKLIKYHACKHSQMHHYAIFYVSGIKCIICATSFIIGVRYPQLDFTANFLKLLQFILICHLHWSSAARARHRDDIVQHVVNPVLSLYILYCTTVVLMGMVDISGTWTECLRPYWLMLSSADFITVQMFAVVALYLTHSNNRSVISTLMLPTASSQTRDLWLVTAVYEISAVVSVVFDAVMSLLGREETGCSGIYNHAQIYYSASIVVVMILKYLLPTWTLLSVFQPARVKSRPSEVALTSHYNTDGTCYNQYRRMFFSQNGGQPTSMSYPTIPYPSEPPMYEGFCDYSYPDSSPDESPTIDQRKGVDIDDAYEKHFISIDQHRDCILGNQYRIDNNRRNLQRSLDMDDDNDEIDKRAALKNSNLTTISEEGSNNLESPQE